MALKQKRHILTGEPVSIIEKAAGRIAERTQEQNSAPRASSVPRAVQDTNVFRSESRSEAEGPAAPIDLAHLQRLGMVTPDQAKSLVAEEFRAIKRPLINMACNVNESQKNANLIMVTSALPKEGKTFCAINLAMSIAMEMDHTVLLVDADVVRPSVLTTLGVKASGGLTDLLQDERADPADYIIRTSVENLSVLPAGKGHVRATELLASRGMSNLMSELATRYANRIIIFDSPPLLPTTEARELARQMGQVVVVVEAETTTQKALMQALSYVDGCANVSLVYNKANASMGGNYSYYGT